MSLNDPRWGNQDKNSNNDEPRRPNQSSGPPDLEEVWKDFNQKISNLFGKNRGRNGGNGATPPDGGGARFFGSGFIIIVLIAIGLWLFSGFYQVDAAQRGVVLRFGKHIETTDPGLHWRLPFPIESHILVNVSGVRTETIGYRNAATNVVANEALMLTDDENIINIQFAVQYVLKNPEDYVFRDREPDETVRQAAETAMREIVGKSKMDFVLYEGREDIAARSQNLMQKILDRYSTGIEISKVTMQNAQPPEQVQAAFDDAVKAGQDKERQKNEGQAYANDVIPKAHGTAARLLEEANGYAQGVVARSQGEASRFSQILDAYVKAPKVTRERIYLETIEQVYSNTSKILVDVKKSSNLLYLPLDKLINKSAPTPAEDEAAARIGAATTGAAADLPDSTTDYRSRDAMRDRKGGNR